MDGPDLIVGIGADISELKSANNEATKEINKLVSEIGNTKVPVINIPAPNTAEYEKALDNFEKNFVSLVNKIGSEGAKLKQLGTSLSAGLTLPIVALGTAALSMNKDVKASFDLLQSNIKSSTGRIGDILEKNLNISGVIDKISKGISDLVDKFESLSPTFQKVIIVVAGLVAAIGPLIVVIGSLMAALPAIIAGLGALSVAFTFATGPIGLVITALGALVAAYFYLRDNTKKAADYQDELALSMSRASSESSKQISELDKLYKKTQDTTKSTKERTEAVNELQRTYPAYFSNIKDEIILNGGAEKSYNRLKLAIVNASKARAAGALLDKRSGELLISQEERKLKIADQLAKVYALQNAQRAEQKTFKVPFEMVSTGFSGTVDVEEQLKAQKAKAAQLIQAYQDEYKDYVTANKSLIDIQKAGAQDLADTTAQAADIVVGAVKKKKEKVKAALQEELVEITGTAKGLSNGLGQYFDTPLDFDNWFSGLTEGLKSLDGKVTETFSGLQLSISENIIGIQNQFAQMADFGNFLGDSIGMAFNSVVDTIANSFSAIGEAMATGGNIFSAAGNAILGGIGAFLSELGKQMIQYGVAALAMAVLSKLLLNPITAAPAAVALIAAGAVLSAIGGAIKGTLSGGASGGGGGSVSGSGGGSNSYSSGFSSGGGSSEVVFRISGNDLVGVLSRQQDKNSRIGG